MNKNTYGITLWALITGLWTSFILLREKLGMSDLYFNWFVWVGAAAVIYSTISVVVDYTKAKDKLLTAGFFLQTGSEDDNLRLLPNAWISFFLIGCFVMFLIISASNNLSGAGIANPYDETSLSWAGRNASFSGFSSAYLGAFVPMFFEDAALLLIIASITFLLIMLIRLFGLDALENKFLFLIISIISVLVAAFIGSVAHARYAGSGEILGWTFMFFFVTQLINVLTGTFVSWVAHGINNLLVISNKTFVSAALTAYPALFFFLKNKMLLDIKQFFVLLKRDYRRLFL